MPDPIPPEPLFDPNLYASAQIGDPTQWQWQGAGVYDPSSNQLGTIVNKTTGSPLTFGMASAGPIGSAQWSAATDSPTNGFGSILMTQAAANVLLASGASVNTNKRLVSGGVVYNAKQIVYGSGSTTLFAFQLFAN